MTTDKISVLNDDGLPLDLTTVLVLFLMPNFILIILTILNAYLLHLSKNHSRLDHVLGKLANFFSKGALDRIIRNILLRLELQKQQHEDQLPATQQCLLGAPINAPTLKKLSSSDSFNSVSEKIYDANYLLLVPFQLDLLLTVLVYKLLTRDVYFETCLSYLTTYHTRPTQVVCWLKNTNKNISNWSTNVTLQQYCTNQTTTYINYEHNDVMCTQYVFKLINIIDTVTNMFAWHQAIVFFVTRAVVFSHWYQQKLRKTICWPHLFNYQRRIIVLIVTFSALSTYILVFVIILPIRFALTERRRIDLTRHLVYACSKFIVGIIVHVNLYTFYQWYSLSTRKKPGLALPPKQKVAGGQPIASNVPIGNGVYVPRRSSSVVSDCLGSATRNYLAPDSTV